MGAPGGQVELGRGERGAAVGGGEARKGGRKRGMEGDEVGWGWAFGWARLVALGGEMGGFAPP